MKLIKYLILPLFLLIGTKSYSQSFFSTDSTKFIKEISNYLGTANKEDAKEFTKIFEPIWFGGNYTPSMRASIYSAANDIALKRLKIYPDFKNYLLAIQYAVTSGMNEDEFSKWHSTVEKALAEKNKSRFTEYIETCALILNDNTIFKSSSTQWKASNNNFTFSYEKEPIVTFEEIELKCYSKNSEFFGFSPFLGNAS